MLGDQYVLGTNLTVSGLTYWDSSFVEPEDHANIAVGGAKVMVTGSLPGTLGPFAMTNATLGGVAQGEQPGVISGIGPCNQGQWVRVWGRVALVNPNARFFVINDGSNVPFDPIEQIYGIKVYRPDGDMPGYGDFVTVSGAVWLVPDVFDPSKWRPMLWELPAIEYTFSPQKASSQGTGASGTLGKGVRALFVE